MLKDFVEGIFLYNGLLVFCVEVGVVVSFILDRRFFIVFFFFKRVVLKVFILFDLKGFLMGFKFFGFEVGFFFGKFIFLLKLCVLLVFSLFFVCF